MTPEEREQRHAQLPAAHRRRHVRARRARKLLRPGTLKAGAVVLAGLALLAGGVGVWRGGVIARLAMVAASYELEATDPDAEVYE
jgi:hypothetical protein